MEEVSVLNLFLDAGIVVKIVMLLLFVASILSWIVIVERYNFFKKVKKENKAFLEKFWGGKDLDILFKEINKDDFLYGARNLFKNSFDEFSSLKVDDISELDLESINRSMRVSIASDEDEMNKHLPFLANVGSVSPYVGLLGTVWGIMNSFQSIAISRNTSLAIVAPGIAEALFATALGLLAAIPAVVAYNKFNSDSRRYFSKIDNFSKRFLSII